MFNRLGWVAFFITMGMYAKAGVATETESKEDLKECIITKKANEGWFIGPAIGTQMYVGDSDNIQPLGYRLTTSLEGQIGKWITPAIAMRISGTAARVTGGDLSSNRNAMNMVFVHADCMFDLISFIKGVDEKRLVNVVPFIGIGCTSNLDNKKSCLSPTVGTQVLFRIHKRISLFTELKGTLLNDKMDGSVTGFPWEGSAVLNAGFLYNF